MPPTLPSAQLDLSALSPTARLDAWRAINPAHDVAASDAMATDSGPIGLTVWHLGPVLFARSRLGSLRLSRPAALIRRDQLDHIAIAVGRGGRWREAADAGAFEMTSGQVSLVDLAQPSATDLAAADALQLVVPRDRLAGLDPGAAHGSLLAGGAAALFADHLQALEHRLPSLPADLLPTIARVTVDLFAACLRPGLDALQRARPAISLAVLQRVRRHVEQCLHDPQLTPETIAASLQISRARLYGLLERFGGVAAYVRARRLARAHALLTTPGLPMPIKEVAYQVGFTSEAQFSRAFRQQYRCTPSEARAGEATIPAVPANLPAAEIWLQWLRELR
jgi:AraC-like DNA-binding protein